MKLGGAPHSEIFTDGTFGPWLIGAMSAAWLWNVHMVLLPRRPLAGYLAGDASQVIKGWIALGLMILVGWTWVARGRRTSGVVALACFVAVGHRPRDVPHVPLPHHG